MEITIVGLGYVGTVSAACFASAGHTVWGVDINPEKVRIVNEGRTPIVERDLEKRIAQAREAGRLRATCDLREALSRSEVCFVAVATPSHSNGNIDATHLLRACGQIAEVLQDCGRSQIVIMRVPSCHPFSNSATRSSPLWRLGVFRFALIRNSERRGIRGRGF